MTRILKLSTFLPYRLSVLSNRISRGIAAQYSARYDLSLPAWRVMAILAEHPDISAADVAERTAMDKVAVSRAVKSLMDQDRVTRAISSEDKRRSLLRLSPEGMRIYHDVIPMAKSYEAKIVETLDAEERRALDHLINRLTEALDPDDQAHAERTAKSRKA